MDDVFVLLDDCRATAQQPRSRLYTGWVRALRCTDAQQLDAFWLAVQAEQQAGLHAAVFIDYEWGAKLQRAGLRHLAAEDASALCVLLFRSVQHLDSDAVAQWLADQDGSVNPSAAGVCDLQASTSPERFQADIARIRELISQGETYQVNYTLRMHALQFGSPLGLYRRLRAMQPVSFGALARLPQAPGTDAAEWVLSSSPELFVRNVGGHLTTRPMKGTATRLLDSAQDAQRAAWLHNDPKNRAENVMIVDLLRNDLGRISDIGSVKVPKLFAVESYKTVHQMTSTVESTLRTGLCFADVLRALFPCGSITGAPKIHTMDLIADLEDQPRGLYCGAIGWVDRPGPQSGTGDFCLSVAIRTLVLGPAQNGRRTALLGVGGGIVLDSEAGNEYAEVQAKARFLTAMDPGLTLFETLRVQRGRARHLRWHLQRLRHSAAALGFAYDEAMVQQALAQHLATLDPQAMYRLRLDLQHSGAVSIQHAVLAPLPPGPALLVLAAQGVPQQEAALLKHKTSLRTAYDAAIRKAQELGAFDAIYANAQGQVTEGARSSLLVKINGRWFTPPLASGVLRGVMRERLLARCAGLQERSLSLDDVLSAQELRICSALRGVQRARWLSDAAGVVLRV